MTFFTKLEKIYAAVAFAEQNQSEMALYVAGIRAPERKKKAVRTQKKADARPRLRV